MMAVCERPLEPRLRPRPARRRGERLVARLSVPEPVRPARSRLWAVGMVSVAAHIGVLAALGTVKLVSASIAPPPLPVTLAGTVRILTEGEAAGDEAGAGEVVVSEPVAVSRGPKLVAMNHKLPALPEVRSPFADRGPVIGVETELAPAGIRFFAGRGSVTEASAELATVGGGGGSGGGATGSVGGGAGIAVLYSPRPVYPAAARAAGLEGVTVLRFEVQPNGSVGDVAVVESSGHESLDAAAVAAVRKWKFVPRKLDGQSVNAWVEQVINFRIQRG